MLFYAFATCKIWFNVIEYENATHLPQKKGINLHVMLLKLLYCLQTKNCKLESHENYHLVEKGSDWDEVKCYGII